MSRTRIAPDSAKYGGFRQLVADPPPRRLTMLIAIAVVVAVIALSGLGEALLHRIIHAVCAGTGNCPRWFWSNSYSP